MKDKMLRRKGLRPSELNYMRYFMGVDAYAFFTCLLGDRISKTEATVNGSTHDSYLNLTP